MAIKDVREWLEHQIEDHNPFDGDDFEITITAPVWLIKTMVNDLRVAERITEGDGT